MEGSIYEKKTTFFYPKGAEVLLIFSLLTRSLKRGFNMQRTDGQSEQSLDVFPNEKIVTYKLPFFNRELSREECIELGKYTYYKIGLSIR